MNYCSHCGQAVELKDVSGDNRPRYVCTGCDKIHYQNPRVIAGCLPIWEDKVLLCKRAIPPRLGFWNVPGGFLENGETVQQGAIREVLEEANILVKIIGLHMVFSIPQINQVYLHFLAALPDLSFSCGEESAEIQLFKEDEIPWDDIAFSSSAFTLKHYFEDQRLGVRKIHMGEYEKFKN